MWDVHDFVGWRAKSLGLDLVALSKAAGKNHAYAQQFVRRRTPQKLDEDVRAVWAPILQCPPAALKPDYDGENPPISFVEPTVVPIHVAERNGGDEHGESFGTAGGWRAIPGSIPEIDASPGAGEGVVGEIVNFSIGSETYSAHPVNAEWVIPPTTLGPRFGMVSSSSLVMLVRGDSMEPTFRSGDPVGVDLRVKSFEGDGIYVFSEPGEAPQIKRLQKVPLSEPRKVRIISDNKTYETDIVELGSIIIHGRVKLTVLPK